MWAFWQLEVGPFQLHIWRPGKWPPALSVDLLHWLWTGPGSGPHLLFGPIYLYSNGTHDDTLVFSVSVSTWTYAEGVIFTPHRIPQEGECALGEQLSSEAIPVGGHSWGSSSCSCGVSSSFLKASFSWKEPPIYRNFTKLKPSPHSASVTQSSGRRRKRKLTFECLPCPKHQAWYFVYFVYHFNLGTLFAFLQCLYSLWFLSIFFVLLPGRSFLTLLVYGSCSHPFWFNSNTVLSWSSWSLKKGWVLLIALYGHPPLSSAHRSQLLCLPCRVLSQFWAAVLLIFASSGYNTIHVIEWECIKCWLRILQSGKKSQAHQIPFLSRTELMT